RLLARLRLAFARWISLPRVTFLTLLSFLSLALTFLSLTGLLLLAVWLLALRLTRLLLLSFARLWLALLVLTLLAGSAGRIAIFLVVQLVRQPLQFFACTAEGFRFCTEHRFSRLLDAFAELLNATVGWLLLLLSISD